MQSDNKNANIKKRWKPRWYHVVISLLLVVIAADFLTEGRFFHGVETMVDEIADDIPAEDVAEAEELEATAEGFQTEPEPASMPPAGSEPADESSPEIGVEPVGNGIQSLVKSETDPASLPAVLNEEPQALDEAQELLTEDALPPVQRQNQPTPGGKAQPTPGNQVPSTSSGWESTETTTPAAVTESVENPTELPQATPEASIAIPPEDAEATQPAPQADPIAAHIAEDGAAYVVLTDQAPLYDSDGLRTQDQDGAVSGGIALALEYHEATEEHEASIRVVFDTQEDTPEQLQGFVAAASVEALLPYEEAMEALRPDDTQEPASYYQGDADWPLAALAFTPVAEESETPQPSPPPAPVFTIQSLTQGEVPAYYTAETLETESGPVTLYALQTQDGQTLYRVYGTLDGGEPGFFACDENGILTEPLELLAPEAEVLLAAKAKTIIGFVGIDNSTAPMESVEVDFTQDGALSTLDIPDTLTAILSDHTTAELPVDWAVPVGELALSPDELAQASENQDDLTGRTVDIDALLAGQQPIALADAEDGVIQRLSANLPVDIVPQWDSEAYALAEGVEVPYITLRGEPGIPVGILDIACDTISNDTPMDYNLITETKHSFTLRYKPPASGTDKTVLVVRAPAYGMAFQTLPSINAYVTSAYMLDDKKTIVLALLDGLTDDFATEFGLGTVQLTNEQAGQWMDQGVLPRTGIRVEVMQGTADAKGVQGTLLTEKQYGQMRPVNYDSSVDLIKTTDLYKMQVPSVGAMTNAALGTYGTAAGHKWTDGWQYASSKQAYEYLALHREQTPLIEITGLKVYAPDARLYLKDLRVKGLSGDFSGTLDKWIISERMQEDSGPNQGWYYHLLTPPAGGRLFNERVTVSSVYLHWALLNEADELDYLPDAYTDYQAPEGELYFRVPTDPDTGATHAEYTLRYAGPFIRVTARQDADLLKVYPYYQREKSVAKSLAPGKSYPREIQASVFNHYYIAKAENGVVTEYLPTYRTGPIIEQYAFPYEIRPTAVTLRYNLYASKDKTIVSGYFSDPQLKLASISYTTIDGQTHAVAQDVMDGMNATLSSARDQVEVKAPFSLATKENYVTDVTVTWETLYVAYHPSTSAANPQGINTECTQFAFDTTTTKEDGVTPLIAGDMARIGLTVSVSGDEAKNFTDEAQQYLWYRFDPPIQHCPNLRVSGKGDYVDMIRAEDGDTLGGDVLLRMGNTTDLTKLQDPIFTLSTNVTKPIGKSNYAVPGMTDAQGFAFLTGRFEVTSRLSGWNVLYTTNLRAEEQTFTIPQSDKTQTIDIGIDLDGGEYLTAVRLAYDGLFDVGQGRPVAQSADIKLLRAEARSWQKNPITGEEITPIDGEYGTYAVSLLAHGHWDNCTCADKKHAGIPGAPASYNNDSSYAVLWKFYKFRNVTAIKSDSTRAKKISIYQGASTGPLEVGMSLRPISASPGIHAFPSIPVAGSKDVKYYAPWGVDPYCYIELTDMEFSLDLNKSTITGSRTQPGLPLSDPNIITEMLETEDGRRFLKVGYTPGYRPASVDRSRWGFVMNRADWQFRTKYINLVFNTLPGTTLGIHHPIGAVYMDYSELLEKYSAPEHSEDGQTAYIFQDAVEDSYGFSHTSVQGKKLFLYNDPARHEVNVLLSAVLGANLVPGQNGIYDFADREIDFYDHQRERLETLLSFSAPLDNEVTEFTGYLTIPRKGTQVAYRDENNQDQSIASEYDMHIRNAPVVVSDSTGLSDNITFTYTTDANPGSGSAYDFVPVTPEDWAKVTGVKAYIGELPKSTAVNIRLNLSAEEKPGLNPDYKPILAYTGGSYSYKLATTSTAFEGPLPLGSYAYHDYGATAVDSCRVFFDLYDEDGTRNNDGERYATTDEVTVTLYDTDYDAKTGTGTVIDTTTTDANGGFALYSPKRDAGQVLKISLPKTDPPEGSAWRLTIQSADYADEENDSDFDRNDYTFALPLLSNTGVESIGAGFILEPALKAEDVTLMVGETKDAANVTLTRHSTAAKAGVDAWFNLDFTQAADTTIATLTPGEKKLTFAQGTGSATSGASITGVKLGSTTATVTTTNRAGDTFTATYNIRVIPNQTEIKMEKHWEDGQNALGLRAEKVKVQLYRQVEGGTQEKVGGVVEITGGAQDAAWPYSFGMQDAADMDGKDYTYTVEEAENYPAYTATPNGLAITNTLKTKEVSGSKVWDTTKGNGFNMPQSVRIVLLQNGKEYKTLDVKDDGDGDDVWPFVFKGLPVCAADGTPYVYTVDEPDTVAGTSKTISGATVTNAYIGDMEVKVTSVWDYTGAPKDQRPDTADAQLKKDGVGYTSQLMKGQGTSYTFQVPQKDLPGDFAVATNKVDGYSDRVEKNPDGSFTITHTYVMPTKDITGAKTWAGNMDGITPPATKLNLWQNAVGTTPYKTLTLPSGEKTYTFKDVPLYDQDGNAYTYIVTEDALPGYTSTSSDYDFTNTYAPEAAKITPTAQKVVDKVGTAWAPDEAFAFTLTGAAGAPMPDGSQGQVKTITASAGAVSFGEIVFTHPGTYAYTLAEVTPTTATEGMAYDSATFTLSVVVTDTKGKLSATPTYSEADPTFRNTYTLPRQDVTVTKAWVDDGNAQQVRPDSATLQLERTPQGGAKEDVPETEGGRQDATGSATAGSWTAIFAAMPLHDDQGRAYTYSVREVNSSPNYESKSEGLTITNTLKTQTLQLTKVWDIRGDSFEKKPATLELWRKTGKDADYTKVSEHTVTGDAAVDTWTLQVDGLLVYDQGGDAYAYIAREPNPQFATSKAENGLTVTNTYGENAEITVRKVWDYAGAPQERRPTQAKIQLLRDGKFYTETTMDGDGSYTFTIPQVDFLNATFTVQETAVPGYSTTLAEDENGVFVFTNAFIMTKVDVTGTKTWTGVPANVTPPVITIRLYQNGGEIKSTTVTQPDTAYAFTGLDEFDSTGKAYVYTTSEDEVAGYDSTQSGLNFTNTYNPDMAVVSLTAGKKVDSANWAPDEAFTFTLTAQDANAPMPQGSTGQTKTVQAKEGAVNFGDVTYDIPGTYTYTVTETTPTQMTPGMTYDNAEYTVTVQVDFVGEALIPTVTYQKDGNAAQGIVFTNQYQVPTQDITVTKAWADGQNDRGVRPDSATVQLMRTPQGGAAEEVPNGKKTLTGGAADDAWQGVYKDLPVHDEQGRAYTYSVRETGTSPNYEATPAGLTITNTLKTTSATLTKVWDIQGTGFTKKPAKLELWRTGGGEDDALINTYEVTGDVTEDTWTLAVDNLLGYSKAGTAYTYIAKEPTPPFATTRVENGLTVTNTYGADATITVRKVWDYTGAPQDQRPAKAKIQLLRDGEFYAETTIEGDGSHAFTIPQVDFLNATFTAKEVPVTGYSTSPTQDVDGTYAFTNTFIMPLDTVSGIKAWAGDVKGITLPTATIRLLQNGTPIDSTTVSDTKLSYRFENLPRYDEKGKPYIYTVTEDPIDGFTSTLAENQRDFTNTYSPQTAKLRLLGQKTVAPTTWYPQGAVFTFTLTGEDDAPMPTGSEGQTKTLMATEGALDFGEIAFPESGVYTYTLREEAPNTVGFARDAGAYAITVTVSDPQSNGTLVANASYQKDGQDATGIAFEDTYQVPTTDLEALKQWEDNDDALKLRPASAQVQLQRASKTEPLADVTGQVATLDKSGGWKHTFTGLPVHDDGGNPYTYSIREEAPDANYAAQAQGMTLTNTLKAATLDVRKEAIPAPAAQGTIPVVKAGDSIVYTIRVTNESLRAVTHVRVMDILPQGVTLAAGGTAPDATFTQGGATTLMWDVSQIAAGQAYEITVNATVNPLAEGEKARLMENHAYWRMAETADEPFPLVAGQPDDPATYEPTESVSHQLISVEKTANPAADAYVMEGQQVTYTLTLYTAAPTAGAEITDRLPDGMALITGSIGQGGTYDKTTHTITWHPQGIPAGGLVLSFKTGANAFTASEIQAGTTEKQLANEAKADFQTSDPNTPQRFISNRITHTLTRRTIVLRKDAQLFVGDAGQGVDNGTKDSPVKTDVGQVIEYTLTMESQGYLPTGDVRITDVLEPGMSLVENSFAVEPASAMGQVTMAQGQENQDGTQLYWDIRGLKKDQKIILRFRVTAPSTTDLPNTAAFEAKRVLVNAANADDKGLRALTFADGMRVYTDEKMLTRQSGSTWHVITEAALSVEKRAMPRSPLDDGTVLAATTGEHIHYEIEVRNTGYEDAQNVRVMDILPQGLRFVESTGGITPQVYDGADGQTTLMWQIPLLTATADAGAVTPDGPVVLSFTAEVLAGGARMLDNIVYYRLPDPPEEAFPPTEPDSPAGYQTTPPGKAQHQVYAYSASATPPGGTDEAHATLLRQGQRVTFTQTLETVARIKRVRATDTVTEGMTLVPGSIRILHADETEQAVPDSAFANGTLTWPEIDAQAGYTQFSFDVVVEKLPTDTLERYFVRTAGLALDNGAGMDLTETAEDMHYLTTHGTNSIQKSASVILSDGGTDTPDSGTKDTPVDVPRGGQVEYVITVTREAAANDRSGDLVITDTLPQGMTLVEDSITAATDGEGNVVSSGSDAQGIQWVLNGLRDGDTATLTYRASVPGLLPSPDMPNPMDFMNTAQLLDSGMQTLRYEAAIPGHAADSPLYTPEDAGRESNPTYHRTHFPVLSITKTTDAPVNNRVRENLAVTYTLTLRNDGVVSAGPVALRDPIPGGMTLVEGTLTSSAADAKTQVQEIAGQSYATWILADIPPQSEATCSFTVKVDGMDSIGIRRFTNIAEYLEIPDGGDPVLLLRTPGGFLPSNEIKLYQSVSASLTVVKIDATTKEPLAGAEFALRQLSSVEPEDRWTDEMTGTTDENGELIFDDVPRGKYVLVETEAPEGYWKNTIQRSVNFDGTQTERILHITNRDAEEPMPGGVANHNMGLNPD